MNAFFLKRIIIILFFLSTLFLLAPAFAQAPLRGKAVVLSPTADLWTLKPDKAMVWLESLGAGQELDIVSLGEKGILKGASQDLIKVRLDSGKEGYVIEAFVAQEPILGAVTSHMGNLYSQARDSAVLPTVLPLGAFVALWPVQGKPDFYRVSAYVKGSGAFSADKYILAADVSTRSADVNAALLLSAAEGSAQIVLKQKALENIDKKYSDTVLAPLVENLRREIVPPEELRTVKVSGSFSVKAALNLRDRPSTGGKVIVMLKAKETLTVDARIAEKAIVGADTDYWYRVVSPVQGWVFGAFLAEIKPSAAIALASPSPAAAASPGAGRAASPAATAAVQGQRYGNFEVGPFEARYYDKKILVKSEIVPRAAINYLSNRFLNIDSPSFSASWTGTLQVFGGDQEIRLNVDQNRSDVTLAIDGIEAAPTFSYGKSIPYVFKPGKHEIRIDFSNYEYNTQMNLSFTQIPELITSQARAELRSLGAAEAQVLAACVSGSGSALNDVTVSLEDQTGPVVLSLVSARAVHWEIKNPAGARILGVFLNSGSALSDVSAAGEVPVFRYKGLGFGYQEVQERSAEIQELFGKPPAQFIGDSQPKAISFPRAKNQPPPAAGAPAAPAPEKPVPSGMALVPGGSFAMGAEPQGGVYAGARPHEAAVSAFSIGKTEVTQGEWEAAMGTNPSAFYGDRLPVTGVTWFEAAAFCNKKSAAEGLRPAYSIRGNDVSCDWNADGYRLPTETEWEYAARGGAAEKAALYAGSDSPGDVAWYFDEKGNYRIHPVGQKKPNALGLYDMSGNVQEWCWDWYGEYTADKQKDSRGPLSGSYCVFRGGDYADAAALVRVSARSAGDPFIADSDIGFRVARSASSSKIPALTAKKSPVAETPPKTAEPPRDGSLGQDMAYIRPGTFAMGDTALTGIPGRTVDLRLSGFYLAKTELTQGEYLRFCDETGANYPDWMGPGNKYSADAAREKFYDRKVGPGKDAYPIIGVSWYDAIAYCNWRSRKEGLVPAYEIAEQGVRCDWSANGYRLPTEAEWEYAAKAGKAGQSVPYSGSAKIDEVGWYRGNSEGPTHPVGQKKPNGFGLYDMSGNVFEWCWDQYGNALPAEGSDPRGPGGEWAEPQSPRSSSMRVIRGGSYLGSYWTVICSARGGDYPGSHEYNVGFRLARSE